MSELIRTQFLEENMTNKNKLQPCPFCGGEAEFITHTRGFQNDYRIIGFSLRCKKCSMEYPKQYELAVFLEKNGQIKVYIDQRQQAVSDWNTRNGME